jgi:hypothetical protein
MFRIIPRTAFFLPFLEVLALVQPLFRHTNRKHDLRHYREGCEYLFSAISTGSRVYLTLQKSGIQIKDYLILRCANELKRYQVESVEYYWEPEDMCILLLRQL